MAAPVRIDELASDGSLSAGAAVAVVQSNDTFRTTPRAFITEAESFTQSGSGATSRSVQAKLREFVSVKDFGALGDGSTDDTTAIAAAISAVSNAGGGTVYFPHGTGPYRANITLTGENIVLHFEDHDYYDFVGLEAADPALPAFSLGDGTTTTRGCTINNLTMHGNNVADKGLLVNGAERCYFNGFSSRGFNDYQIKFDSSATQNTFFIFFDNFSVQPGTDAASLGIDFTFGSGFVAAVFMSNGALNSNGSGGSYVIQMTGASSRLRLANVWIDADNNKGINFVTAGARIECSHVMVDSDSAADVLVTIPDNGVVENYIFGLVDIDGIVSMLGGNTVALTGRQIFRFSGIHGSPHVKGNLNFQDSSANAWEQYATGNQNQRISRSSTNLNIVSTDGSIVLGPASSGVVQITAGAKWRFATTNVVMASGTNTPEGALSAPVGSIYMRDNGGAVTTLYVKESGTGNTGWVAK